MAGRAALRAKRAAMKPTISIRITGKSTVIANLSREVAGIKKRTRAGIRIACLLIRRRAQQKTPVDTGNLKNTAFTHVVDSRKGPIGTTGYTAAYAPWVHERMEIPHDTGEAKFLQRAIEELAPEIPRIIHHMARLK